MDTMPKFLDVHPLKGFEEETLKKLQTSPVDEFGIKHVNIMYNQQEDRFYCLLDAPDRQACCKTHLFCRKAFLRRDYNLADKIVTKAENVRSLENEINSFPEKAKISVSAPTESINVNAYVNSVSLLLQRRSF